MDSVLNSELILRFSAISASKLVVRDDNGVLSFNFYQVHRKI